MDKKLTIFLVIDTCSSNEFDDGGCDYCLVQMTADYVAHLLRYMDEVAELYRSDDSFYSIELWDPGPRYLSLSDAFLERRDVDGNQVADVPRGEPILLAADPHIKDEDLARVECQSVQASRDSVWWTAYVKHTNIRIESAQVQKKTLLRIFRKVGGSGRHTSPKAKPIHPAVQQIHDLLYLDARDGRRSYDPHKAWDADTMAGIAEIISRYIPRPKSRPQ